MYRRQDIIKTVALILGILLMVNLLSSDFKFRWDFTEGGQYTLSQASVDIVEELEEPITVSAYFSGNLPIQVASIRRDLEEMLIEYSDASEGMVVYNFIDPNESDELKMEAMQKGVRPVPIQVRDNDQYVQQQSFLGAVVERGDESEAIPFFQPGAAMEYSLSKSIKKVSVLDKPTVAVLQGHGEPPISELFEIDGMLSILYTLEALNLNDSTPIPPHIKTLAIIRPKDSVRTWELAQLDGFLGRGGNLLIALNRVEGDMQTARGSVSNTGFEAWLVEKGVTVEPAFLIDASCASVGMTQYLGNFPITTQVQFPYFPLLKDFSDHPITRGLEAAVMQFASPITFTGDSSIKFTPLVRTSENSGSLHTPIVFEVQKRWSQVDFPIPGEIVGAALEGKLAGNTPARMVVFSDGDFAVSGPLQQGQQQAQRLQGDNANLMVNSIDWLSDDTGLIELRSKQVIYRPIDQLGDGTRTMIKYLNFGLPILLIIIYGGVRASRRRKRRNQRQEESYV